MQAAAPDTIDDDCRRAAPRCAAYRQSCRYPGKVWTMFKFKFEIQDEATDEIVTSDWTLFDTVSIDDYGACETIDIHVASALRYLRRVAARHSADA